MTGWREDTGPAWSTIVPNTDSVPSRLSTTSTIRDCCGQSMWAAVFSSQKPPGIAAPVGRPCGSTWLRCVWPLTQTITLG